MPIAMSKFAALQAKKVHGIDSVYIPHGYDKKLFFPIDKNEAKRKLGLQGKFVVGTVARNQGRKMLDRTIKAFAIFCRDKPDAVLLMHTDPTDIAAGIDLNQLITRFQLQNRVFYTGTTFYKSFDYNKMNEIYNAMDLFFLSTSGEGFGIPTIEAMACGVPQVVTDYTTTKELVTDKPKSGEAIVYLFPHCGHVAIVEYPFSCLHSVLHCWHQIDILLPPLVVFLNRQ